MRVVIAAVLAAVIMLAWGAISWTVVGWHAATFSQLGENEAVVAETLRNNLPESGAYFLPDMAHSTDWTAEERAAATEAWTEKHRTGPVGIMLMSKEGFEPMQPSLFLKGAAISFVAALIAGMLLASSRLQSYGGRVLFVAMLGVFAGVAVDMSYWNWLYFPLKYSIVNAADHAVGWTLVGLMMAAIVKPKAM